MTLYDFIMLAPTPQEYINSLYEICEDECKEFCCIRRSVAEEVDLFYREKDDKAK